MSEIKINTDEISNAVAKLNQLKTQCDSLDFTAPETVGGGQSVEELVVIAQTYKQILQSFSGLIANTAAFLENVKESYISSDVKASTGIKGE